MNRVYQYRPINANIKRSAGWEQEGAFLEIPRKLKKQSLKEGLDRLPSPKDVLITVLSIQIFLDA